MTGLAARHHVAVLSVLVAGMMAGGVMWAGCARGADDGGRITLKCPGSTFVIDAQGQTSCAVATPPASPATPDPALSADPVVDAAMKRRLGHDFAQQPSAPGTGTGTGTTTSATPTTPAAATPAAADKNLLTSRLQPEVTPVAMATMMRDQNLTISKGTLIPCGTLAEIDTTLPGLVTCRVSHDVYSVNGKVRLVDKGAMVQGEVASALQYGQSRIFINWLRLRNPDGVSIDLASPGTTPLGSSGVTGKVNRHFWARFGDAIMVSVITDVGQLMVQAITNLASKPGTTSISTSSTTPTVSDEVEKVILAQTANVPPTLRVPQGNAVGIYVARDLDFTNVYALSVQ